MREPYSDVLYFGTVVPGTPVTFLYPDAGSRFVVRRVCSQAAAPVPGNICAGVYLAPGSLAHFGMIFDHQCSANVVNEPNPGYSEEDPWLAIEYDGAVSIVAVGCNFSVVIGGYRLQYPSP